MWNYFEYKILQYIASYDNTETVWLEFLKILSFSSNLVEAFYFEV